MMFVSRHDALLTVLVAAYAGALALWAARPDGAAARWTTWTPCARRSRAVGEGRRDVRTGLEGDDEIARARAPRSTP